MNSVVEPAVADRRPNVIDVYVGNRLRLGRKMVNVSQEKLAESLGVTFQQVQKYEKGSNRISASRLHQAARILDVPVAFFFPETEPVRPARGAGPRRDPSAVLDFLSSSEGLELNRAFSQIRDSETRRQVINLIRSIAVATD